MNKKMIYIIAGLAGVITLAGGAFFAMRLMNNGQVDGEGNGGMRMSIGRSGPGGSSKTMSLEMVPAPEIPTRKADASGIIKSMKDDNFIVQGGNNMIVAMNEDGDVSVQSEGPTNEVVITRETKIYRDVTFDTHEPTGDEKIQQEIEPMEAEEIEKNDMVSVWGTKRGDRLIAEVILINRPILAKRSSEN